MTKHFINLTNGIERIPRLLEEGIPLEELNFCYIASTTLENKSWIKLFDDLDHNLLFNLAIGNTVIFHDYGTKRLNSKTVYYAIPLIRYVLTRFWFEQDNPELCYRMTRFSVKRIPEIKHFGDVYDFLFIHDKTREKINLKTKLMKYKNKFLLTDKINLFGISEYTVHDGDYDYYKNIISEVFQNKLEYAT